MDKIIIKTNKVIQPIGEFYTGVINSKELLELSFVDYRTIKDGENFLGLQRLLDIKRQKDIKKYVRLSDSTIPNSIIVSVSSRDVLSMNDDSIELRFHKELFKIIDVQHRLSAFENSNINFDLIISIFIDKDDKIHDIFRTINSKQVPVNPSLKDELESQSLLNTPEKFLVNIIKGLNYSENSPVYKMISIYGDNSYKGKLSLAGFKREAISLIYNDRTYYDIRYYLQDNIDYKVALKNYDNEFLVKTSKHPFFEIYRNEDSEILFKIFLNYFEAIKNSFKGDWSNKNSIIFKSIFFRVWIKLLHYFVIKGIEENDLSKEYFESCLKPLSLKYEGMINKTYFNASSYGDASKIYLDFREILGF